MNLPRISLMAPARALALACGLLLPATAALADEYAEVQRLQRSGQTTEALARADKYIAANPRDPQMRFVKAGVLSAANKTAEAEELLVQLTRDYPELPEPWNNLAVLHASRGQLDKAQEALQAALRINPAYATALENLGDVRLRQASEAYQRARQIDPGNPRLAPKTVENFLQYVKDKHYDGLIFHRVIKNFMVQGGGYDKDYKQRPTRPTIKHEGREALAKGLKNLPGTIAMARTNDPHSASSQFFINVVDNTRLDPVILPPGDPVTFEFQGQVQKDIPRKNVENHPALFGYTVFGKVVSGMDTVMRIRQVQTGPLGPFASDVPRRTVLIESASQIK